MNQQPRLSTKTRYSRIWFLGPKYQTPPKCACGGLVRGRIRKRKARPKAGPSVRCRTVEGVPTWHPNEQRSETMTGEMRVWLLEPKGTQDSRWRAGSYREKIVVRARNAAEARRMAEAAIAFPTGREKAKGRHDLDPLPSGPWRNADLTDCRDLLGDDVEPAVIAIQGQV